MDFKLKYCINQLIVMTSNNKFMMMRQIVEQELNDYKRIKKKCEIKDPWHSATIERLCKPFLEGCFTLAIVGKMSSGKSTFINAIIGKEVLPTGHFQTTSAITYIERGEKPSMDVVFCDGSKKHYEGEQIVTELRNLVAVPEEFSDLPINDINRLISGNASLAEIIKMKPGIEARTNCADIDVAIWKKYISSHPKKTIAKQVYIKYPLSDEFIGWRIVDTPGVGAIGGIQDETKKMLTKESEFGGKLVDAIIFLQSGADNIEDEACRTFVSETINQLTDDARSRLFFILTHATVGKFRSHRDAILAKAHTLYAEPFKIPNERLSYVDSLLGRFCEDAATLNLDLQDLDELEDVEGWSSETLEVITDLWSPIKKALKEQKIERTNETILALMREWANFIHLKRIINDFVEKEKSKTLDEILRLIRGDYEGFINSFLHQIDVLKGGKAQIEKEKEKIKKRRIEYNNILNKLRRLASIQTISKKFDFVDTACSDFVKIDSIPKCRTAYLSLMDKVKEVEKGIFNELTSDFKQFGSKFDNTDLVLKSIDFANLESTAEKQNTSTQTDYSRSERVLVKEGGWSSDDEYKTTYPYTKTVVDHKKKVKDFIALVIKSARSAKTDFMKSLTTKVEKFCDLISSEINKKLDAAAAELQDLEKNLSNKDELIDDFQQKIDYIKSTRPNQVKK